MHGVKVRIEITVHRGVYVCVGEKKTPVRAMRFRVADDEIRQSNRYMANRTTVRCTTLENTKIHLA